jgi:hypothetical protein
LPHRPANRKSPCINKQTSPLLGQTRPAAEDETLNLHLSKGDFEMFTSMVTRTKRLSAPLLGVVIVAASLAAAVSPASALGDCGPNRHRGPFGGCRWGGQNEGWCLRHTGHVNTPGPGGTHWCL